jgi:tetratricopeptide (TPR) repeat protein
MSLYLGGCIPRSIFLFSVLLVASYLIGGCRSVSQTTATETQSADSITCESALKRQQSSLTLNLDEFDQTPNQGWRSIGEEMGCYQEAAELIVSYLNVNATKLQGNQDTILHFHAGQMYAFAGDYKAAIPWFKRSFDQPDNLPPEAQPYIAAWNAYVNATIAFLNQDRAALERYRAEVAKGPNGPDGKVMNLHVVERLINNVDKSYRDAYNDR